MQGAASPAGVSQERKLLVLVKQLGFSAVAENLGVTNSGLQELLEGRGELDARGEEGLERICAVMGEAVAWWDLEGQAAPEVHGNGAGGALDAEDEEVLAEVLYHAYSEGELQPAAAAAGREAAPRPEEVAVLALVRTETWEQELERRRQVLWRALDLSVLSQFRLGMPRRQQLEAMVVVIQLELALIMNYNESVPDPGVRWDLERRHREIERRLARKRWAEEELRKAKGPLGYLARWLGVEGSGKELYQQMIIEADESIMAVVAGRRQDGRPSRPEDWVGDYPQADETLGPMASPRLRRRALTGQR